MIRTKSANGKLAKGIILARTSSIGECKRDSQFEFYSSASFFIILEPDGETIIRLDIPKPSVK
jgi:hypothetical protein